MFVFPLSMLVHRHHRLDNEPRRLQLDRAAPGSEKGPLRPAAVAYLQRESVS